MLCSVAMPSNFCLEGGIFVFQLSVICKERTLVGSYSLFFFFFLADSLLMFNVFNCHDFTGYLWCET